MFREREFSRERIELFFCPLCSLPVPVAGSQDDRAGVSGRPDGILDYRACGRVNIHRAHTL